MATSSLAPCTVCCRSQNQAMPVWVVAALLSDMGLLGVYPWDPQDLLREENFGEGVASVCILDMHPVKALCAGCSLLQFRGWYLLFSHLHFYLLA